MAQASTARQSVVSMDPPGSPSRVFPLKLSEQNAIRATLLSLSHAPVPMAHRLQLMVEYASAVSGLSTEFMQDWEDVEGLSQAVLHQSAQSRFSVALAKRMPQGGEGFSVVAQLAQMRGSSEGSWGVDAEFRDAWRRGPEARLGSCEDMLRDPDSAWRKYRSHVEALDALLPGHLDHFSCTFAANYWSRCRWNSGETLLTHVQRMLLLLFCTRVGIATDPEVFEGRSMGREILKARVETASRKVMWATVRAFDQHPSFTLVVNSLDPAGGLAETRGLCQV